MTNEYLKKALEQVQNMCQARPYCNKECPFYNTESKNFFDCFLAPVPENWVLDQINERKGD